MEPKKTLLDTKAIEARLLEKYPFGIIPRIEIAKATGHIVGYDTVKQKGMIEGEVKIGGRICYPVASVIDFIVSRMAG